MKGRAGLRSIASAWKQLEPRFGSLQASQITIEDSRAHIAERREKGIKDGTLNTELGYLRSVLVWAKDRKIIPDVPIIEIPPKPRSNVKPLSRDDVRRLIAAAEAPHIRLYIILAVCTGARNAAILDLTWDRVDFETNLLDLDDPTVKHKHKNRPKVPMNPMLRRALEAVNPMDRNGHVIKFLGQRVYDVKKALKNAARRAGIKYIHPHKLRHTAAVHMIQGGASMEETSQFLGHQNSKFTEEVYGHFERGYLSGPAGALNYDEGGTAVPGSDGKNFTSSNA
jgi:integrase